jgi:hypothetical protein
MVQFCDLQKNEERRKDRDSLHEATEATEERDEPEQDAGNLSPPGGFGA